MPILYDPFSKRVFTFNGKGGGKSATNIDAAKGEVVGKIDLGGQPEFAATDEKGTAFVNIEDTAKLVAFDPQKLAVKSRWNLTGCEEATGLSTILASPPIGEGCDPTAFDPGRGLAFASAGDGTITVIKEEIKKDGGNRFSVAQTVTTQKSARTMTVDTKTHQLFTIAANLTGTWRDRKIEPDSSVAQVVEEVR